MKKSIFVVLGFALLTFGFLSIVLSMIGLQLSFLTWLDNSSRLIGFVIRIGMVLVGIIMMALATTDWEREFRESSEP
ncbi:MAG: hypothetical protein KDC34_00235 [Saprospiraceae bacterium]|nr:hypothetical protein [Saprospiraceae bacterium]